MNWQSLVLGSGNILFSFFLFPIIKNSESKLPFITSILTSLTLMIFSLTFYSLQLYYPSVSSLISSSLWLFIAFKRRL